MGTIRIKNWGKFQHYKRRSPPWIKLHKQLLDDFQFQCLQLASKALAPLIWLLGSEHERGEIPCDLDMLAFRLRTEKSVVADAIKDLEKHGFIDVCKQGASTLLAERKQDATPETETEAETETELPPKGGSRQSRPCPVQKIVDTYHETLPELPRVKILTASRKNHIQARWRSDPEFQDLAFWQNFFSRVKRQPFLMGENDRAWRADLEFLVKPKNFAKVIEGHYDQRKKGSVFDDCI